MEAPELAESSSVTYFAAILGLLIIFMRIVNRNPLCTMFIRSFYAITDDNESVTFISKTGRVG